MAVRFAVDHDFPEPILIPTIPFLPFETQMLRHIDQRLVEGLDDWQVILALSQRGYDGLITLDYHMLDLPKEMSVLHQTRLTLVAIEAAGDSPLRAMGQLLVNAPHVLKNHDPTSPQIFRIPRPRPAHPVKAWGRLGELVSGEGLSIQEIFDANKLTPAELQKAVLP